MPEDTRLYVAVRKRWGEDVTLSNVLTPRTVIKVGEKIPTQSDTIVSFSAKKRRKSYS